ncbi:hypothetical protein FACS189419_04970 [Planctomycetales bacterium]|nr:hypothetical protein FACS189419_04970 [Planctomycetales bacterium]
MIHIAPEEISLINARISNSVKSLLKSEAKKAKMSMTEYLERLIEGTLPNRLETKLEEILQEIKALREIIDKKK